MLLVVNSIKLGSLVAVTLDEIEGMDINVVKETATKFSVRIGNDFIFPEVFKSQVSADEAREDIVNYIKEEKKLMAPKQCTYILPL